MPSLSVFSRRTGKPARLPRVKYSSQWDRGGWKNIAGRYARFSKELSIFLPFFLSPV